MASRFSSSDSDMAHLLRTLTGGGACGCEGPPAISRKCRKSNFRIFGQSLGGLAGEDHRVAQPPEAQAEQVERIVLVELPRPLGALLGLQRQRALDVARGEADPRLLLQRRIAVVRRALPVSAAVHVVQ